MAIKHALSWDKGLLLALSACALGMAVATPQLISPYPQHAAWFESAATFPRVALCLSALMGVVEVFMRRHSLQVQESEELDSSQADPSQAMACVALFGAYMLLVPWMGYLSSTVLFMLCSGWVLRLGWRATASLGLGVSVLMWLVFVKVLHVNFGHGWWV